MRKPAVYKNIDIQQYFPHIDFITTGRPGLLMAKYIWWRSLAIFIFFIQLENWYTVSAVTNTTIK